jgi:hypothetical protein
MTGFMQAATMADAFHVPLCAHCAPALHAHPACAAARLRHIEYFFAGLPSLHEGSLRPDWSRPGHGLVVERKDVARHAA